MTRAYREPLPLFDLPHGRKPPMARTSDPLSSHVAADQAEQSETIRGHALACLQVVVAYPGLTSDRIATEAQLLRHRVMKRLPDLRNRGFVTSTDLGDGSALRWFPTEKGRRAVDA